MDKLDVRLRSLIARSKVIAADIDELRIDLPGLVATEVEEGFVSRLREPTRARRLRCHLKTWWEGKSSNALEHYYRRTYNEQDSKSR